MVHFIFGRSYARHEEKIVSRIADSLGREEGSIFYLVPDHLKFQSELNVLQSLHNKEPFQDRPYMGMIHLQVLSFSRLAWYLMQDQAIFQRPQLSDAALAMVIQHILIENKDQLTIYQGEIYQAGFIQKLVDLFEEFRQGRLTPELLAASADELGESSFESSMAKKFEELSFIYNKFNDHLAGQYIHNEDILDALMAYISQHDFSSTQVFINHFSQFTAKEMELILCLAKHCQQVTVALPFDQAEGVAYPDQQDVFFASKKTFYQLFHQCRQEGLEATYEGPLEQDFSAVDDLFVQAEDFLLDTPIARMRRPKKSVTDDGKQAVELWQASSRQAEIFHLVSEIRQLVTVDHYRYKDIIILSRQIEDYQSMIQPFFDRSDLPLFIDHSKSMADHSLIHFIQSLLDIQEYGWRQEDVINLLRTEWLLPLTQSDRDALKKNSAPTIEKLTADFRQLVDQAENFILRYGINYQEFYQDDPYDWVEENQADQLLEEQAAANFIRQFLRSQLLPFYEKLQKADDVAEALTIFYLFFEKHAINQLLLAWRDWELENGQLESAREYEEIWQSFVDLLDETVEILGSQAWDIQLFSEVLSTAFEQATYSNVPPAIDQVILTDFNRLPALKNKVVFIIGLTQDCLPLQSRNESLLTDEDRQLLEDQTPEAVYLLKDSQQQLLNEQLLAYQLMTQATERLYLTYTQFDDDNKDIYPSEYFKRFQEFLGIPLQKKSLDASSLLNTHHAGLLNYTPSTLEGMSQLLAVFRQAVKEDRQPDDFWLELFDYFNQQESALDFHHLLSSLSYKNEPVRLKKELTLALYGEDLYLSVSQVESFYQDPYSYFLKYGLKLQERQILELNSLEKGVFLHAAMDLLVTTIQSRSIALNELKEQEINRLVQQVVDQLSQQAEFIIFEKSHRMAYRKNELQTMLRQMLTAMVFHSKEMGMKPYQSELLFGFQSTPQAIPALTYPLKNNRSIRLRGKIDRVDIIEGQQKAWFNVVDYKSSKHKLDMTELYYGLSIQLLTYLKVMEEQFLQLENGRILPAGAFYSQIKNPFIKVEKAMTEKQRKDFLTQERQKEFILQGLIVDSPDFISFLNDHIGESESSGVFQLKRKKDGAYDARSQKHLYTIDQLHHLYDYVDALIVQAGERILQGDTRLMPFDDDPYTPSLQDSYRAVSQFDAKLRENTYRPKVKRRFEDVIDKLEGED